MEHASKTKRVGMVVAALVAACAVWAAIIAIAGFGPLTASADQGATASAEAVDRMADRVWVDDAGREHVIPGADAIVSIYYTSPISEIYGFTLAPDLGCGTNYENLTEQELKYLPEGYGDKPYLGTLAGGKELNPEAIVAAQPQLILSISQNSTLTDSDISSADDLQAKIDIPVILLKGGMDDVSSLYARLGDLLGCEEDAAVLSEYCANALKAVEDAVATVPEDERVTLYYAEGPEGLQTEPETSSHALTYKIAGAKNVAEVEVAGGKGLSDVSLEQVLAWNPEVIIAWSQEIRGGADELIMTDPNWASIKAVQDGRVYTMPNTPFSWCDRPPSVNRYLGIQWVANLLYPEAYDVDMVEVTKEFYSLFYHVDITDEDAIELLGNSYTPAEEKSAA